MSNPSYDVPDDWPILETRNASVGDPRTNKGLILQLVRANFARSQENLAAMSILQARLVASVQISLPNAAAFFAMLASCGGILSGSWALWFILTATTWVPNDMDIVVPRPTAAQEFRNLVIPARIAQRFFEGIGYIQTAVHHIYPSNRANHPDSQAHAVWKYQHPHTKHKVDIIESPSSYAIDGIRRFHSTAVMNGITGHHIFVMYPQWTFKGLSLAEPNAVPRNVELKYHAREFVFPESNSDWEEDDLSCPDLIRGVGREGTVVYAPFTEPYLQVPPPEVPAWHTWDGPIVCESSVCASCKSLVL